MPNFIHYEIPAGKKQDGFKPSNNVIPITELTQSEAAEYGELMKQAFIEHWGRKAMEAVVPKPPEDRIRHTFKATTPPPPKN